MGFVLDSKVESIGSDPDYAEPKGDHFFYFAYGSNLLQQRLRLANPSAEFVATGELDGYALGFGGPVWKTWQGAAATIHPSSGSTVHGVVYKISKEHSKTLDTQEHCYRRLLVPVKLHHDPNAIVQCRTYIMREEVVKSVSGDCKPSPHYKHVIVSGAKEMKLPLTYIQILEAIEHNGYNGRVAYELDVLKELNTALY